MLKCLLVDDDVNMLELLQEMVPWETYGYEIMGTAQNGEEAMKLLAATMPDIIITDVRMPLMDGISFCSNIRKLRKDIPIILLSAYENLETARLALKYNVTEYMIKPLTPQNIELLCQILQDVASIRTQSTFFTSICSLPGRQTEITGRLKNNDADWFQDFFAHFTNCSSIPFQLVQTTCFVLIRLLYTNRSDSDTCITEQNSAIQQCTTKLEMVSLVANLYQHSIRPTTQPTEIDYHSTIFDQIHHYIDQQYTNADFGVTMLSERFHFSTDHINRIFHRYTGENLNAYINQKRMDHALNLLQNSSISINDIAILSGFRNRNYFSRVFRKYMMISPKEYRLQLLFDQNKTRSTENET